MQHDAPAAHGSATLVEAWPRAAQAVLRRAMRMGLTTDEAEAVLFDAYCAALEVGTFRSSRGVERFAVVVAGRDMRRTLAQRVEAGEVELVPIDDLVDELTPEGIGHLEPVASPSDSPADRAVFRAGFDAALLGLRPPPTSTDLRALRKPLGEPIRDERERRYWSVRLHRVRKRLRADVRDLLAPAAMALRRVPTVARNAVGVGALGGGAAFVALGVVGASGAAGSAEKLVAASDASVANVVWSGASTGSLALDSTHSRQHVADASTSEVDDSPEGERKAGLVVVTSEAELWRRGGAAGARSKLTVVVSNDTLARRESRVEVYCDTPTRAVACDAMEAAAEPSPTGPVQVTGS